MLTIPFTYYLFHKPTGKKYYGVRYAKGCSPESIWTTYFTSSKQVKKLIKEYGADSFVYEVRRVFDSASAAKLWESTVQRRLRVDTREDWLNLHVQDGQFHNIGHSAETKERIRETLTGRAPSNKGKPAHNKGKPMSEEQKAKLSAAHKGKPSPKKGLPSPLKGRKRV